MDIEYLHGDEPFDYEQLNRNFRALAESSSSDIFFAQYGVSTNAEIWAAKQAGKLVVCNDFKFSGDLVDHYTFVLYAVVENKAWFISFYDNNNAPVYFSIICENDEWTAQEEEQLTTEVIQKTVLIPQSSWTTTTTATQRTITVTGLKAYMVVIVAPSTDYIDTIRANYVRCISHIGNKLIFQCDTKPTETVAFNILAIPIDHSVANADLVINVMDKPAESDVFYATYGTTTSAEIKAAYQAGKAVFVKNGVHIVPMYAAVDGTQYVFTTPFGKTGVYRIFECADDVWSTDGYSTIQNPTTKTSGQYLKYNGSAWVAADAPGGGGGSGTSKRYATKVIGTSLAGYTADEVDYLCDGTDDQVEINQAMSDVSGNGGEVLLLEGNYYVTDQIEVVNSTILRGSGMSTNIFQADDANPGTCITVASSSTLKDLKYTRSASVTQATDDFSIELAGNYARVSNVWVRNSNAPIFISHGYSTVENCVVSPLDTTDAVGIWADAAECVVCNCRLTNFSTAAIIVSGARCVVHSNRISVPTSLSSSLINSGISIENTGNCSVFGNTIRYCNKAISCANADSNVISNNVFETTNSTTHTFFETSVGSDNNTISSNNGSDGEIKLLSNGNIICANQCGEITNSGTGNIIIQGAST